MSVFTKNRPVHAFLNVHSGWDDSTGCAAQITHMMESMGVPVEIHQVGKGMDIVSAVRQSVQQGAGVVIAGGGDGTLNAVASALRDTSVPMALIPIGTLNHLARDLGVPLDAQSAIESLRNCGTMNIDLGEVNGRIFLNNSIIGLYPAYAIARQRFEGQGRAKGVAILAALFTVFRFNPSFTVRMSVDGRDVVRRTPYILIANNEHKMEGYELGKRTHLNQGLLWIYVMRRHSRWELVRLVFSLLSGRFRKNQEFETFAASSVEVITRRKRLGVALDGDVTRMRTPLKYRSLPGALTVVVPAEPTIQGSAEPVESAAI